MAVITDIELRAGFQVRVRWYAQATQRYPANENEYYSTFFSTLEPNSEFELEDPRFVIEDINDNSEDLQYIIRDVCYTDTLVPQFVDFIYINPDYITATVLDGRVDGGTTVITVDANPDSNFNDFTLAAGQSIQIGPIQSDVYTIASVAGTGNVELTLTSATTKTFPSGTIVAQSNTVTGDYPDVVAETALSRVLDNTGSLTTGTIQVTTPLYFDIGETVRRFYYDAALQTPFNGARGSGDTENITVVDPRDITREIEAGWWAAGDTDNEAAEEACLIDSEGFLIAKRDRSHAFEQVLYFAERETAACTSTEEAFYLSNHPDFTDDGYTSIRNADPAFSIPIEGFYAWQDPTIYVTPTMVTLFFGDNQFRPGFDAGTGDGITPSVSFSGFIGDNPVSFTVDENVTKPDASPLNDVDDSWEILRSSITTNTLGELNGLVETVTSDRLATNRFVRYWNGNAFDAGRVHPSLTLDNCPTPIGTFIEATVYDTQQNAACVNGGESQRLFYTAVTGTDFSPGNVTAIFTDQFGFNADVPSGLGVSYIRYNDVVYLWNGSSLSPDNEPCTARYCADPSALNTQNIPGGIPDNSLCVYQQFYCNDTSASNYVDPINRVPGSIADNSVCTYPPADEYTISASRLSSGATPAEAYNISVSGVGAYSTGSNWSVSVSVTLNRGWEGSIPSVTFETASSGTSLARGESFTVQYRVGEATATEVQDPVLTANVYTGMYSTDQQVLCEGGGTPVTLYYHPDTSLGLSTFLFKSEQFLNNNPMIASDGADTGWYTTGSSTFRVAPSGGLSSIIEFGVNCPTGGPEPPAILTPITLRGNILGEDTEIGETLATAENFTQLLNNPDALDYTAVWNITGPLTTFLPLNFPTSTGVAVLGTGTGTLSVAVTFTDPTTGNSVTLNNSRVVAAGTAV